MAGKTATSIAATIARDLCGLIGAAAIVAGAALVYLPAGFIVAGALMLTAAFLLARRA